MKRLKTFALYILILILFFIGSRIVIFIGLNNTYNNISLQGSTPENITIDTAKATSINGEVRGKLTDAINAKYVKFDFYTDANTLAGTYYLTTSEFINNNFEFYFKLNHVKSYSMDLVDEKPETADLDNFSYTEFSKYVLLSSLIALMFI